MKDSSKKSIIPKTVVSAPEKDTVGDLIDSCTRSLSRFRKNSPRKRQKRRRRPNGKKSIIPKTNRFRARAAAVVQDQQGAL